MPQGNGREQCVQAGGAGYAHSVRQALPNCRVCGGAIPEQANYCPSCGIRLLEDDPLAAPPKVRLFGVVSPLAMFVLACVLLVGAIVAFATSGPILAIMLLAGAGAVFVLFYGAAERDRSSAVARGAVKTKERVRAATTVTTSSARAWSTAGRDVLRLRGSSARLGASAHSSRNGSVTPPSGRTSPPSRR